VGRQERNVRQDENMPQDGLSRVRPLII
jgi:hypothetical protein